MTHRQIILSNQSDPYASRSVDGRFRSSNYLPSDTERVQLTDILQDDLKTLEMCQGEIAVLEEKLQNIKAKERALKDNTETCCSALSPQRRVPTEVWEQVFSHLCLSLYKYQFQIDCDDEDEFQAHKPVLETPALVLTRVCSRWRDIALALPHIWASVSVEFKKLPFWIDTPLNLHFVNAKDYPLNIRLIRNTDLPLHPLSRRDSAAWRTLSPHISRCKNLSVELSHFDFPEIQGLSFPDLESFTEEAVQYGTANDDIPWFWGAIQNAPKLTRVSLSSLHLELPYSRLTWLEIRYLDEDDLQFLFVTLASCRHLESLELWHLEHDTEPLALAPVEVPSLRELKIHGGGIRGRRRYYPHLHKTNHILSALFTSLFLPSLISLELQCEDWPPSLPTLAQQSTSLERVKLTITESAACPDMNTHPITTFLQYLPRLTRVELLMTSKSTYVVQPVGGFVRPQHSDDVLSTILSGLQIPPDNRVLLSKLESISLRLSDLTMNSQVVEKMLEVVKERYSASRPVKEFLLYYGLSFSENRDEKEKFVLEPKIVEKIREAESGLGVKMVIDEWTE
ncbi:hypothetical protein V5O48_011954 [Marasmius crinis-equi]|uniref:F-box domain-containing protein n=1 Tax=Marasmius crinis-equi TaxID=585013 RepID=A0ABR3F4Q7_9AGAR